jgi:hypothetical protein
VVTTQKEHIDVYIQAQSTQAGGLVKSWASAKIATDQNGNPIKAGWFEELEMT